MQSEIPFSNYNMSLHGTTDVAGRPYKKGDSAYYSFVSTNFVKASGIRLLKGRGFLPGDESSGGIVALVNEAFVRIYLSGRQPIGVTLRFHRDPGDTDADLPFTQPMTVVGVVQNEVQGADLGAPYEPMVYLDHLALPETSFLSAVFSMSGQYAVRSALPETAVASELRAVVKQDAPTMVEMSLNPMEEQISQSLGQRRLALRLVAGFGIVALILSAVGIYGVLAYSVTLRRREIGIRMALGAQRASLISMFVRQGLWLTGIGIACGLVAAFAAMRLMSSLLFNVNPVDPVTYTAVTVGVVVTAYLACYLPSRRAATVNPVDSLRAE